MPPDRPTAAALPLALVVCVLVVAGVAATPGIAVGKPLTATAPQNPAAGEAALALDRPTRRLIQQGLRNEGFDPGTPDGLFGPRTRAAIRDWQQSRRASPPGYLSGAEVELLRTAATPHPAVSESAPPPQPAPAVEPDASSPAAPPVSTPQADSNPAPPAVATKANRQNAAATNTEPTSRPAAGSGTVQLPPDIMVDRHLVRTERFLADGDPSAALESMNESLALHQEHDVVLQDDFDFQNGQVAFAAGRTQTAVRSLNEYPVVAGREGEFYREALESVDAAEVRLERKAAQRRRAELERRRADAARRRAARWPPGHLFRDCETCPEMVVLRGSAVALGRYEVTLREYRAFASVTTGGASDGRSNVLSDGEDRDHSWRNPGFPQTDRHPVRCVSWDDAQSGVCVLADPDHGNRVSSTHDRDIGGSGGEFSARMQLLRYGGHRSGRQPRPQQIGPVGPARERGRGGRRPAPWTTVGAATRPQASASRRHRSSAMPQLTKGLLLAQNRTLTELALPWPTPPTAQRSSAARRTQAIQRPGDDVTPWTGSRTASRS